ncbi:hypothetical protein ACBI99_44650 [Nonomuraea sp. ATR24]|uniref:hypothetical protein n=1 Tax=Nonomuraea sp. ATR24 TaxID=1676744 RepID=UPI0035BF9BB5
MSASPRRVRFHAVTPGHDQFPAPPGVAAGDTLIAFVTSTAALTDLQISGGNPWTQVGASSAPFNQINTTVFATQAGPDNPTTYAIDYDGSQAALVGVLHLRGATLSQLLLATDAGEVTPDEVPCPDASPGVAGGVEVRVALGRDSAIDLVWDDGLFPVEGQDLLGDLSMYIGARTSLTDADLPVLNMTSSSHVFDWQAWTLVVTPGDYVPPPPPTPSFTQGKGIALYRYTAHDFMTGTYIDDIYPDDVTYDKRILEPGRFSGRLPIPNRRVAAAVRRVIPRLKSDLTTGPGRVEIRIWRDGELWGRYWLTGARLTCGRDGKISVELRGSTLDAYWYSVRVRDTLELAGDQVINVRGLLQHAQSRPGAFSGILFQPGASGVDRPLTATKDNGTSYGRAAAEYARTDGGFEYTLTETIGGAGVQSTWTWAYPKLGSDTVHLFSQSPNGGETAEWSLDIDALQGGTDFEVRGGTPETDATETRTPVYSAMVTTPHRAAGWPRIDALVDHPHQSTDAGTLDAYAAYWAARSGGALWVRTLTVFLGKSPSLSMNSLGDMARQVMSNVWYEHEDGGAGLDIGERIIGISIRPPQKGRGKEEATLVLESVGV